MAHHARSRAYPWPRCKGSSWLRDINSRSNEQCIAEPFHRFVPPWQYSVGFDNARTIGDRARESAWFVRQAAELYDEIRSSPRKPTQAGFVRVTGGELTIMVCAHSDSVSRTQWRRERTHLSARSSPRALRQPRRSHAVSSADATLIGNANYRRPRLVGDSRESPAPTSEHLDPIARCEYDRRRCAL
jgi:hypothetical protein